MLIFLKTFFVFEVFVLLSAILNSKHDRVTLLPILLESLPSLALVVVALASSLIFFLY
jgi:hypothetical protein